MDFSIHDELAKFNKVKFDEDTHAYTVDKIRLNSVTRIVGTTEFFDELTIATKKAESMGVPVQVILDKWHRTSEYARLKGTEMHSHIENLWLNKKYKFRTFDEYPEIIIELGVLTEQYETFYLAARKIMDLIIAEFRVYDIEYRVAGTFDGLFYNKVNNCYDIWDWKTSAEIKKTGFKGEKLISFPHLEACNFNTYALQLSIYKFIIERNTNIKIRNLHICQISTLNKSFNAFRVPYLKTEAIQLLEKNKNNFS